MIQLELPAVYVRVHPHPGRCYPPKSPHSTSGMEQCLSWCGRPGRCRRPAGWESCWSMHRHPGSSCRSGVPGWPWAKSRTHGQRSGRGCHPRWLLRNRRPGWPGRHGYPDRQPGHCRRNPRGQQVQAGRQGDGNRHTFEVGLHDGGAQRAATGRGNTDAIRRIRVRRVDGAVHQVGWTGRQPCRPGGTAV